MVGFVIDQDGWFYGGGHVKEKISAGTVQID